VLPLQRELNLEGSRGSKNHTFLVFFFSGIEFKCSFRPCVFDILCFFVIWVDPLGFVWRPSREPKSEIKVHFSPDASRGVPWSNPGPIFGGFRRYLGCTFGFVFNDFLVVF
jgi:hypothetical protein